MTWISIHCQVLLIRSWLNDLIVNCMVSNVLYRVVFVFHSRLSGEEGRQFLPAVEKHFSRLGKAILTHITGPNPELSQAALQALGFCVYHAHVVSGVSEILSALCSLVVSSTDKNSCTRALWVISKQSFPSEVVAKKVDPLLEMLERVMSRRDIQSLVMEHEALNVVIRLLEQAPVQMGVAAVRWSKLVIPMVVHSASKVRLRAAAAMELGLPLLLERQNEVAAVIEPLMPTILVPELQKLFASKNEVNVLKLWPLFVKLLGKHLHRGGPFINSLLHLEELGFRSSSPNVKKIAFIAWKSLIDNFALNPEILCSAKRMKLLLQPLLSIHVRTEALQLSRLEVWWYLVVRLGPNLGPHFEQVSIPLLQCTIRADSSTSTLQAGTPVRGAGQNSTLGSSTPKTGTPANTPRLNLSLSQQAGQSFPPIQLLGLEMLLHYFLGPEVVPAAARVNLQLTLEPLTHSFLSGGSTFSKHAALLISSVTHGFISVGADAPDPLLVLIWRSLVSLVSSTVDSGKCSLTNHSVSISSMNSHVTTSPHLSVLLEITVKAIHPRVLGSAAYQVGKMDVLNGTPALFLILLLYNSDKLSTYAEDERFFQCLNTLVGCGLAGPTSSLAFVEAVLGAAARRASFVPSKEHLWRMWSAVVTPLTDAITQSNEVNQGDALEHDFSAVHSSLMFPVRHLLLVDPLPQMTQKSLLSTWSKLYRVFARCSALVLTAEENVSCEELCVRMAAFLNVDTLSLKCRDIARHHVNCKCDTSPPPPSAPCTPVNWTRKRSQALGNLAAFQALLIQALEAFLVAAGPSDSTGLALASVLSTLFNSLAQATPLRVALGSLLEKLLVELLGHLQSRSTLDYDDQLLLYLAPLLCVAFPHKNKALRTQATHFWNATFAKASSLAYPEELKPVLSQVKRKTPIILPGFEAVAVSDEHSGPYSSSNLPVTGQPIVPFGQHATRKESNGYIYFFPLSRQTKLDFGSPKPPPRGVLEEEASIDFVFIPPENKERVLTEHQKEVKRTKRGDLPAMYNNLDASLDTTAFTQYTQSQEDSTLVHANQSPVKVLKSLRSTLTNEGGVIPDSADVSMQDAQENPEPNEGASADVSGGSDLVSGTPPKPNSRRQSFITLEKYVEGQAASPIQVTKFTGRLTRPAKDKASPAQADISSPSRDEPMDGTPEATSEAPAAPEEATTVAPAASQAPAAPETAALPSQTDRQPKPRRSELSLLIEGLSGSSTDEDKRRAGAANSISQEDSQALTLSSSGSQLQNRLRRRGKASAQSLEAAEKSQNLTESELDAEAQASPSAVRTRTRSSFPHGEQVSQTIFSSLDKAALAARKPNSGRGKYPRRRSSQALLANNENSESESSETRESPPSKKKISYHKAPLVPSPLTVQSAAMDDASETSQSDPSQGTPTISPSKTKSLLQSQKEALISLSRVPLVFTELEQQCEVGVIPIVALEQVPEKAGTENTNPIAPNTDLKCKLSLIAPSEEDCEQRLSQAKLDPSDQVPLDCESTDTITERSQEVLLPPVSAAPTSATNASSNEDEDDGDDEVFTDATDLSSAPADHRSTPAASGEATANQSSSASGSSEEKVQHVAQPAQEEVIAEVPQANSSEPSGVPADGKGCEDAASTPAKQDEGAPQKALDILVVEQEVGQISSREDPAGLAEATTSVQDEVRAAQAILCPQVAEEEPTTSSLWNSTHAAKEDNHSSPAKRLTPEVGLGLEVAQSPSGRTRGTWSPSASPSSSILKKAQKRALEEDAAISPLVKSRRVSFANPIQHQELADDIDRRSPVVRTSSPKRFKSNSAIPHPTAILTFCHHLVAPAAFQMSEMSQEPRAIPKDCVFPSLVCCSAPIEAVLPLISTNMWPRGFGQLVRAKNIRTVGDLSSLKPLDIKTLPIRSPKITNVKKALQLYEAQRKMRGFGDELKSFEEMEKMMSSSEPEETNTSLNQEEDGKTPHETLGESRLLCGRLSE
uniref:Replication timing regulatory factor 1 n=1 Tax=Gadus morhua TaxID=8049 RepID=A0A8C5FB17_GADMO